MKLIVMRMDFFKGKNQLKLVLFKVKRKEEEKKERVVGRKLLVLHKTFTFFSAE